jgi:hypothetical protein
LQKKRKKKMSLRKTTAAEGADVFLIYWKTVVIANVFVPNEKIVPIHFSISIATGGSRVKLKDRQQPWAKQGPPSARRNMPSDKIEDFCNEILKAGTHLAFVSGVSFPNTESVSNAISCVLSIVEQYNLVGRWITSRISKRKKEYATTKEIHHVSCFVFFLH